MECNERVLSFIAEWFDPHPQIVKKFLLKYHCATTEVEMKDIQTKRTFLKKTKVPPTLKEESFFIGANILLLSRDLKLIQYADNDTRNLLEPVDERSVVVCPPSLFESLGNVISLIEEGGFTLVDLKTTSCHGSEEAEYTAGQLLNNIDSKEFSRPEPLVAMSFRGTNSIQAVKQLIESSSFDNVSCATNAEEAMAFTNFFLMQQSRTTATFEECTCCVIKPHAVVERSVGDILSSITSRGFTLSAASMFTLDRAAAAEFLEVYDGVVPEYPQMVDELCSGRLLALEVRLKPQGDCLAEEGESTSTVEKFRQACGPWDVEYAKELHPESLRAKYGTDKVRNAVHCTDLPKDGPVESEYFFKILANAKSIDG